MTGDDADGEGQLSTGAGNTVTEGGAEFVSFCRSSASPVDAPQADRVVVLVAVSRGWSEGSPGRGSTVSLPGGSSLADGSSLTDGASLTDGDSLTDGGSLAGDVSFTDVVSFTDDASLTNRASITDGGSLGDGASLAGSVSLAGGVSTTEDASLTGRPSGFGTSSFPSRRCSRRVDTQNAVSYARPNTNVRITTRKVGEKR